MLGYLNHIPGISPNSQQSDLPVLLPYQGHSAGKPEDLRFSRWLASSSPWVLLVIFLLISFYPLAVLAQSKYTLIQAFATLWRWLPFVVGSGFVMNLLISFFTMLFGTVAGVFLGLGQISVVAPVRKFSWFITQLFRNSPWLVLLFIVMLTFPFEIEIGEHIISIPDWMKAVFGLSLPIMANISEVVRGAVQSVPTGQWEASESLAFSRVQTIWKIILPQCFKRMIPPWMNWYAILTMATPLVSLLGVEEIVTLSRQAMEAEDNHPELLIPFFGFALLIFFAYCYPIARWTLKLEERYSVKL
ncbi:MAG: amino acid ABC transporter permease [SAR324 cluster bacterium]|jgi:polar amino acid transport system permease protein|uniref:ABC transmembrane type-1 domain-containing protein n=1 Tax=marine metagenome TaxID=408172 RepID=A0A381TIC7_9ZZZZ|nr:amino acid ABC transporter permease [SAR324 cluster bacterium]MEC9220770.1 amino acid ABC transporter permease [SAR324 cluster bacterium]|tara:strand:- start:1277 stop:2182 length:906 start_codon:yes stop_codon:yes gene_type:complete